MDPSSVHRTLLPNGLTVLVQEDRSAPVVAIVTYVKAGYFDETDEQNGLAHALEHMFFKGTEKRGVGEIAKETKARGGYLSAHTILSMSGDVDPADALRRVTELYGDLQSGDPVRNPGPPEPDHDGFRYRELSGDIAQSQLVFGWRTPGTLDPDTAVLDVAASL